MEDTGAVVEMSSREYRVYGPPGTGKTTWLARQTAAAAEKYGPSAVVVMSFTKAAAAEAAGRGLSIPKENVGTIHAICYRALGKPVIAETRIAEFCASSSFKITGGGNSLDDPGGAMIMRGEDDSLLADMNRFRGLGMPPETWRSDVRHFHKVWTEWKQKSGYMDYTDLLEEAYKRFFACPGNPEVLFVDEAQDLNPLMVKLIRKWGERTEKFILVGDDDQAIYEFIGADPEAFLSVQLPEQNEMVLSQSYRVPRKIQQWADMWIRKVSRRAEKAYKPRDEDGKVERARGVNFKDPPGLLRHAKDHLDAGDSVMFLAACGYQLNDIITELRSNGIPFHNPYCNNGQWNPIKAPRGVSICQRIAAWLKPDPWLWKEPRGMWTWEDVLLWLPALKVGPAKMFTHAESIAQEWAAREPHGKAMLDEIFRPESPVFNLVNSDDVDAKMLWFLASAKADIARKLEYPMKILKMEGGVGLEEPPQVVVGTIHSVKGGQADAVYICPDLSRAGYESWMGTNGVKGKDSVIRQFYVGATRARSSLYFTDETTPHCCVKIGGVK